MNPLRAVSFILIYIGATLGASQYDSALVGSKNCGKGASFWCENFANAIECSAVKHCIQTVWEVQNKNDGEECFFCTAIISSIRSAFPDSNGAIETSLPDVCSSVSYEQRVSCIERVSHMLSHNLNDLTDLIRSSAPSTSICKLIELCDDTVWWEPANVDPCQDDQYACSNFTSVIQCKAVDRCVNDKWKNMQVDGNVGGPVCAVCVKFIEYLQPYIKPNSTKEQVESMMEDLCVVVKLFEDKKQCEQFIDKNVDLILSWLADGKNSAFICMGLDLCSPLRNREVIIKSDNIKLILPDFRPESFSNIEVAKEVQDFEIITQTEHTLLGANSCTWGPSYWCNNITSAAHCKAVSHCINFQWKFEDFEEDNDDVCAICKDMVQQARDTLQSNETQEELKEVFEGSCKLIPIKEIAKECIKMTDEFVPELTEMLLAQMNPTAVCTVAGLCNNVVIDEILAAKRAQLTNANEIKSKYPDEKLCRNCHTLIHLVNKKFRASSKHDVFTKFIQVCGELSSYSDFCSSSVTTYYDAIYDRLVSSFEPYKVCFLTGMCSYKYHFHPDSGVEDQTDIESMDRELANASDDLPCDLCEQLVNHLRDILISNTTEQEFHQVMAGMCKQTGKFANECLELVDNNFHVIYEFLTNELNATEVCVTVGLCKKTGAFVTDDKDTSLIGRLILQSSQKFATNGKDQLLLIPNASKLEEITPKSVEKNGKGPVCEICEYIMHFIETELDDPKEQKTINDAVLKVCRLVPASGKTECEKFIDQYSSLIISIISDELDPSLVCPELNMCPDGRRKLTKISCPLCLLAVQNILNEIQDNKTQENIEHALDKLCTHLPTKMTPDCIQFVNLNYQNLIDMVKADFTSQEVCVFLQLCKPHDAVSDSANHLTSSIDDDEIETNDIPGKNVNDINDLMLEENVGIYIQKHKPVKLCTLCQTVIKTVDQYLVPNITKDEAKKCLEDVCRKLRDVAEDKCLQFVDKYVDKIFDLISVMTNPDEICGILKLCPLKGEADAAKSRCQFCEAVIGSLNGIAQDPYLDYEMVEYIERICNVFPIEKHDMCVKIVKEISPTMESIAFQIPPWFLCTKMKYCPYGMHGPLFSDAIDEDACTWGPSYWCQSRTTAAMCQAIEHCKKYVWKDSKKSVM